MNTKIKYPRQHEPNKVFITWQITYMCNYKCTYCHTPKHGQKNVVDTVFLTPNEWIKRWDEVYDLYGECEINISGGEPTIYPNFIDIVEQIIKKHKIEIISNLSFNVEEYIKRLNPERVRFALSFHPEHVDIDLFISKVITIKKAGYIVIVNFVPWPPFLEKLKEYKEKFENNDIKLVLQPFIGRYNGVEYPLGYSDTEKKYLGIFTDLGNKQILNFRFKEGKKTDE